MDIADPAGSFFDAEDGVPFVLHNVGHIRSIHTGAGNDDYFATVTYRVLVNANGEIVVDHVVLSEECR